MAKTPDPEARRPRAKVTEIAVWGLMAMLVLGLGGFGVTSFSGGVTSIGSVGDIEVSTDDYARALQARVADLSQQLGVPISAQQAIASGLDRQVLQGLINRAALDHETQRVGLSVGDDIVADRLKSDQGFQGVGGSFDREIYRFQLERTNQTEAQYEAGLRLDVARDLLQGAVSAGFIAPAALTDALYAFEGERRGFSVLRLAEADLSLPLAEPSEADLAAFHTANIASFTRPEARRITFAALLPETIAKDQPVDETVLRELYDDRIEEFVIPERRIVERLVYPDDAAAEAARAQLDAETPFETLVADRGLTLDAIDLGDVTREDLDAEAETVFAAAEGGVVGPVPTPLGPAFFRVVAILTSEETSFDEARETLALEIQTDTARRLIADKVEEIDDLLAGGATLEDLAKDAGLALETVDYVPGQQGSAVIEGYPAFRAAADIVTAEDFSEAIVLEDGGVVALRLDEIVPAAPIPLTEARDQVAEAWRADALAKALGLRAVEIKSAIEAGSTIGSFGIVDVTPEAARASLVADLPETVLPAVFAMAEGDVQVLEAPEFVAVVRLDRVLPAVSSGDEAEATKAAIAAQLQRLIAQDAMMAFTNALTIETGITLDQSAINAVHTSLP